MSRTAMPVRPFGDVPGRYRLNAQMQRDPAPNGRSGVTDPASSEECSGSVADATDGRADPIFVQHRDEVHADLFRADRLALAHVGAGPEPFLLHLADHPRHPLVPLWLP